MMIKFSNALKHVLLLPYSSFMLQKCSNIYMEDIITVTLSVSDSTLSVVSGKILSVISFILQSTLLSNEYTNYPIAHV